MSIKQVSVFVENRQGALCGITDALAENGIDMKALTLADTADFGIMRMIVTDTEKAKEVKELDELKALDAKVKRPANVFAYVFGSIGAIVMGAGMSLVMTTIGETLGMENVMLPGIIIGVAGLVMTIINYRKQDYITMEILKRIGDSHIKIIKFLK